MQIDSVRLVAFVSGFLVGTSTSYGQDATVSINNSGSFTTHEIAVESGGSFTIDINVDTDTEIFHLFGMQLVASRSDVSLVTSGAFQSPWESVDAFPIGELNPSSPPFWVVLPDPQMFGPGQSSLITVDVAVPLTTASGVYTLNIEGGNWTVCRGCQGFASALIGPDFVVNVTSVIPTVSEWGIVVLAIGLMATGTCVVRRRHSIQVKASV